MEIGQGESDTTSSIQVHAGARGWAVTEETSKQGKLCRKKTNCNWVCLVF